ncbi:MAG: hypothetical protein HQK51_06025 [Oligoflexia bacterium]|nr:hypothetical protein [Oligoflexia bacterium]
MDKTNKVMLLIMILINSEVAFAAANTVVKFPARLICNATERAIAGSDGFSDPTKYFPQEINNPQKYSRTAYDPGLRWDRNTLAQKVMLDFSDGGDQYEYYFFNSEEMTALAEGKIETIQGIFEDGFVWIRGYNTRARFVVKCTK